MKMNDVAIFGGKMDLAMDDESLKKQLQEDADFGARGTDGVDYLSFSGKMGTYACGIEKNDMDPNELWLVAIPLFKTGYICWKGRKPVSRRLAGPREPRIPQPAEDELGPFNEKIGEGWYPARAMGARSLATGLEIDFTNNSKSGVAEIAALHRGCLERVSAGEACWPVVTFDKEKFEAQGQVNFKPVIKPTMWLTTDQIQQWKGDFDPMAEWVEGAEAEEEVKAKPRPRKL